MANVLHAGDGNLHPFILYDGRYEEEIRKAEELGGKIMKRCIEMGGSITGKIFPTSKSCVEVGQHKKDRLRYEPHRIEKEGLAQRL